MLGKKERAVLRFYWKIYGGFHAIRITSSGQVEAKQRHDSPWGVLENPEQAKISAAELIKKEVEYLRWKEYDKGAGRKIRKR